MKYLFAIIVDFKLINKREIKDKHFRSDLNKCLLNEQGKRICLKEFDDRLKLTILHPELKRNVSHRRLIRLECYKLVKHLIGDKVYDGFKIWW